MATIPNPNAAWQVFTAFLVLGCSAFGGPVAHIAAFRATFVDRRAWLSSAEFDGLVAMCHLLPGPTSSQVGFLIGLQRAGSLGGASAFFGFTTPSALLMAGAALGLPALGGAGAGLFLGLNVAAVAIVTHAVVTMAQSDLKLTRLMGAGLAGGFVLVWPSPWATPLVVALGAGGALVARGAWIRPPPIQARGALPAMGALVGLSALWLAAPLHPLIGLADGMARAGALVFGGGHVVLPMLTHFMPAADPAAIVAGYSLAQAVPGPLFTIGVYVGIVQAGWLGGVVGLAALFAPGLAFAVSAAALARGQATWPLAATVSAGAGAAVLGVLGAAWVGLAAPLVAQPEHAIAAALGYFALSLRTPPLLVVAVMAGIFAALA